MENSIQTLAISAIPIIFAITLHEAAHGYVARHFGDPTAWQAGRISLNPLRHIDPLGTIAVPALTYMLGGFMFGWAKPVPVNFGKLRNPKRDMLWVAAAGPGANLLMACAWALIFKFALAMPGFVYAQAAGTMAQVGIQVNGMLMLLNLLPLPPLDGGRIAVSLLPGAAAWKFARLERYGFAILLALLFFGILGDILMPLLRMFMALIAAIFAI